MMKSICLAVLVGLLMGCALSNKSSNPPALCCGVDSTQMIFKAANGREVVSLDEVTAVDVKILPSLGATSDGGLSRSFSGDQARKIVGLFRLAWPTDAVSPSSLTTGEIDIYYARAGSSTGQLHKLSIQDGDLLEDENYTAVTYETSLTLDKNWLSSQ